MRELKLEIAAMNQRWDVSAEQRKKLIDKWVAISIDDGADERLRKEAWRALLLAESQNQLDDFDRTKQGGNRILEIAERLGLRISETASIEGTATASRQNPDERLSLGSAQDKRT